LTAGCGRGIAPVQLIANELQRRYFMRFVRKSAYEPEQIR
jgi:hypothetical protein